MTTESPGNGFNLGGLIRSVTEAGFPILGGLIGGPAGAALGESIAARLGKRSVEEAERAIAERDPNALVELRRIELETLQAEIGQNVAFEDADVRRVEAINATMRAEAAAMITNPAAGAWRPLWGRWTCYNFFPVVYLMIAATIYCVVSGNIEALPLLVSVFGVILGAFALPGAILGVASWKRGGEKEHLAEGIKSLMQSQAARSAKPTVRATPIDGLSDYSEHGGIFKG